MASVSGVRRGQNRILFPSTVARNIDHRGQIFFRGCFTKINLSRACTVFTALKAAKRKGKWEKDKIIVAGEMWSISDSDPYGVFRPLRGGVGLPSFANLEFSRLFNEILVHYQNLSGWQGKELEFVGRGNHPAFHESRDDMQICIITCYKNDIYAK